MQAIDLQASREFNAATALLRQGRLREAEPLLRAVLARQPGFAAAAGLLGAVLGALGRLAEAEPLLRQAAAAQPDSADAQGNLGNLLRDLGRPAEAEVCLRAAIGLRAGYPEAHNNLGALLRDRGDADGAERCFREALRQRPGFALCRANLARLLLLQERFAEAEAEFRAIAPASTEAACGLGESLRCQGRLAEAEAVLREALPRQPEAVAVELGNVLLAANRPAEAAECFARVPALPGARLGLGLAQAAQGDYAAAERQVRAVLASGPLLPAAHNALGDILRNQGALGAAEASLRQALALAPAMAEAQVNLAFTLLQAGRLAEGWAAYEHRWRAVPWVHRRHALPGRLWNGEPPGGRSILLQAEQGLGDTLQFARYATLFPPGTRVVLQVQRPLVALLRGMPGVAATCALEEAPPQTDWHCPLMSLPHRFPGPPPAPPYLAAAPDAVAAWRRRLEGLPGLRVGLAWAGSPGLAADARRSLPLHRLEPLGKLAGISFVSLQRGPAAQQAAALPLLRPEMAGEGFEDTAALVAALDLVVSVDTSVLHLAGALGRPVWLLNRYDACWRWQQGRDDSPWYPQLRQFRQPAPGDWDGALAPLAAALQKAAAGR